MLRRRIISGFIAVAVLAVAGSLTGRTATALLFPAPQAPPAIQMPTPINDNSSCANACQIKHDQCRVTTKGGPDCDAQLQRCLQHCLSKKTK